MALRRMGSAAEDGVHERRRVERRQVVRALAEPDQLHRDAELALHGDHDAALGGAVELGEHDAGDAGGLSEEAGLLEAILAGGGVDDEQGLVGRAFYLARRTRLSL